ncbi:MAG: B12-binding domain-containing radical SAM protein [Candidatus Omnitrophica bacterium]|nr:B12-binding domain-containing radical SAM protein [Candidatus Omnitrophota bacterium]
MKNLDLLVIKPGAQKKIYQNLSKSLSGLEPPLWAGLLGGFIRERGFNVDIIDAEIEPERVLSAVVKMRPRLVAIVASGTNPSASTTSMVGARELLDNIKKNNRDISTILIGLHPSALPEKTLREESVDFVCEGEGFFTVLDLLSGKPLKDIKGLFYEENCKILSNPRAELVDSDDLSMPAWDLLAMNKYRAHNWHCFGHLDKRSPYGVIYTSLGCPFNCSFCCINAIFGKHTIRYRDPDKVIREIDYLVENYGIKNFKIMDEMFALKEERVIQICDSLIQRGYNLNIWAYARVDTLNENMLKRMKQAGINWLGIGFESGSKRVRDAVSKGRFDNEKMKRITSLIHSVGIHIGANFIFGLPEDDLESLGQTLDLAKELNCEYANFYVAMAYPGSKLYEQTLADKLPLPDSWLGYSQFSFETQPLPTKYLTASQILKFRDDAFEEYFSSKRYQDMILDKFGIQTLAHIQDMLKFKLKRRLLEEQETTNKV